MIIVLLYCMVFLALIPTTFLAFDTGFFQLSPFRVLVLVLPVLVAIDNAQRRKELRIIPKGKNAYSVKFYMFWFFYAFLSGFWVKSYHDWSRAVYFIGLGLLSVVILSMYSIKIFHIRNYFRIFAMMTLVNVVIGWLEVTTQNYYFIDSTRAVSYGLYKLPVSWFYNTNDYATFLLLGSFIVYACLKMAKSKIEKLIWIGTLIGSLPLIIYSDSRANILGLFCSLIMLYFITLKRSNKSYISLYAIMLIVAIIVIFFIQTELYNLTLGKVRFSFEGSGSDRIRLNLLKNGGYFLLRTFGFGVGAGNIEYWMEHYKIYSVGSILNIHNWWGELITAYGIVIFLGYILLYWGLFRDCFKQSISAKENKETRIIATSIACSLVGFVIGAVSSSSNISSEWLWVYMGVLVAFQGIVIPSCS